MPKVGDSGNKPTTWVKTKVLIHTDRKPRVIQAEVLEGTVAAHPDVAEDGWSVTVLSCGLRIVLVSTEEEAKRVGEVLVSKVRKALAGPDKSTILEKLPGWVKPWVAGCRKARAYVNYKPYLTKK